MIRSPCEYFEYISTRAAFSYMSRDSCPSLHSTSTESHHLALVFFDVLLLGNASLLNVPYSIRRSMLESVVQEIPGQAMLAERFVVSSGPELSMESAAQNLREIWAQHIAESQEGLVLKSGESVYGDWRLPWVKVHEHIETVALLTLIYSMETVEERLCSRIRGYYRSCCDCWFMGKGSRKGAPR